MMYKVGDEVILLKILIDVQTARLSVSKDEGVGEVFKIIGIPREHSIYDYVVKNNYNTWYVRDEDIIPVKVTEQDIYKALTEIEC